MMKFHTGKKHIFILDLLLLVYFIGDGQDHIKTRRWNSSIGSIHGVSQPISQPAEKDIYE